MISVTVSRAELGLTDLVIGDTYPGANGYSVASYTPGAIEQQNVYAKSRWVNGAVLTSTRRDISTIDLSIRVKGSSLSDMAVKVQDLEVAFSQFGYLTTFWLGMATVQYTCMPANYQIAPTSVEYRHFTTLFTAQIPRQP